MATSCPSQWTACEVQEWLRNEGLNAWSQVWHATGHGMNGPQLLCLCDCQAMQAHGITDAAAQCALGERLAVIAAQEAAFNLAAVMDVMSVEAQSMQAQIAQSSAGSIFMRDQLAASQLQAQEAMTARGVVQDACCAQRFAHDMHLACSTARHAEVLRQLEEADRAHALRLAGQAPEVHPAGAQAMSDVYREQVHAAQEVQAGRLHSVRQYQLTSSNAGAPQEPHPSGTEAMPDARSISSKFGKVMSSLAQILMPHATEPRFSAARPACSSSGTSGNSSGAVDTSNAGNDSRWLHPAGHEGLNRTYAVFDSSSALTEGRLSVVVVGAHGRASMLSAELIRCVGSMRGKRSPAAVVGSAEACKFDDKCVACMEPFIERTAIRGRFNLPCGHAFCDICMGELMTRAMADTSLMPLRCCKQGFDDAFVPAVLSQSAARRYSAIKEEACAVHKMYCTHKPCSHFINIDKLPPGTSRHPCGGCGRAMCVACRSAWHTDLSCAQYQALPAELRASPEDVALTLLAQQKSWQRCPSCRAMVELVTGCYHMTCRCGHQFCYVCAARWKSCTCPAWEERRLLAEARERVEVQRRAAPPQALPFDMSRAVAAAVRHLRVHHDDCTHVWSRRQPPVSAHCRHCNFRLFVYCYYCSSCHEAFCHTCRFHRLS